MMQTVGIFSDFFEKIRFSNFLYRNYAVTTRYNNLKDKTSFFRCFKTRSNITKIIQMT